MHENTGCISYLERIFNGFDKRIYEIKSLEDLRINLFFHDMYKIVEKKIMQSHNKLVIDSKTHFNKVIGQINGNLLINIRLLKFIKNAKIEMQNFNIFVQLWKNMTKKASSLNNLIFFIFFIIIIHFFFTLTFNI